MTVKQAAEVLGLSEKTVYNILKRTDSDGNPILGHYRPVPGSQAIRIGRHHLDAYLESIERPASESPVRSIRRNRHPLASQKFEFLG